MARFMTGVRVARRMVIVPVASDTIGCIVPSEDDCCDGGSGSGIDCPEGCTELCIHCPSMAKRWTFLSPGDEAEVTLCYVENADSGNTCEFMSADSTWLLYAATTLDVWILENLTTGEMWFLSIASWDCTGLNHMEDALLATAIDVSPVDNCVMGWDCVDDDCVEEPGGAYATLEECQIACDVTPCCDVALAGFPNLKLVVTDGPVAGTVTPFVYTVGVAVPGVGTRNAWFINDPSFGDLYIWCEPLEAVPNQWRFYSITTNITTSVGVPTPPQCYPFQFYLNPFSFFSSSVIVSLA
jgi:hypothetical protein